MLKWLTSARSFPSRESSRSLVSMPTCLLFDLFGTLVEYETDRTAHDLTVSWQIFRDAARGPVSYDEYVTGWERAFAKLEAWSRETRQEFQMHQAARALCESFNIAADAGLERALEEQYMQEWMAPVTPIPGAAGLLRRLAPHYRLGLISNTHYPVIVTSLVDQMDLGDVFEVVVTSAEVGVPKPQAEIFEKALRELGLDASEAVYIGDSFEHDYKGATAVGIDCYLIGKHARVPKNRLLRSILDLPIYFNTAKSK